MTRRARTRGAGAALLAAWAIAGCAADSGTLSGLATGSIALPSAAASSSTVAMPVGEAYARVARGALGCWFGPGGALKATHIFHADLDPPERGGRGEIIVHERDAAAPKPWGRRAYRIALSPGESTTGIEIENIRLAEALAQRFKADVARWLAGTGDCDPADAVPPPPPAPVAKGRKKAAAPKAAAAAPAR